MKNCVDPDQPAYLESTAFWKQVIDFWKAKTNNALIRLNIVHKV